MGYGKKSKGYRGRHLLFKKWPAPIHFMKTFDSGDMYTNHSIFLANRGPHLKCIILLSQKQNTLIIGHKIIILLQLFFFLYIFSAGFKGAPGMSNYWLYTFFIWFFFIFFFIIIIITLFLFSCCCRKCVRNWIIHLMFLFDQRISFQLSASIVFLFFF